MENVNPLNIKAPNDPISSATVLVTVVNENEAPRFVSDPMELMVPESVPPGSVLIKNIAYDPDNAKLRSDMWKAARLSLISFGLAHIQPVEPTKICTVPVKSLDTWDGKMCPNF